MPEPDLSGVREAAEALVGRAVAVIVAAATRPRPGLTRAQRLEVWDVGVALQALSHALRLAHGAPWLTEGETRELADELNAALRDLAQAATALDAAFGEVSP